jgi:hypothetical protein
LSVRFCLAGLNRSHEVTVKAASVGERFLREAALLAQAPDSHAELTPEFIHLQ